MARGLAPVGPRSGPKTCDRCVSGTRRAMFYDCYAAERGKPPHHTARSHRLLWLLLNRVRSEVGVYAAMGGARVRAPGKKVCRAWPRRGEGVVKVVAFGVSNATKEWPPVSAGQLNSRLQ